MGLDPTGINQGRLPAGAKSYIVVEDDMNWWIKKKIFLAGETA